jgi:F0F1-type ATP synthase assembly protein I
MHYQTDHKSGEIHMPESEKADDESDSAPEAGKKTVPLIGGGGGQQAMLVVSDGVLGAGALIMLGVWGGNMLDDRFHTAPWISLGLSLFLGGLGLARLVSKANQLDTSPGKFPQKKGK